MEALKGVGLVIAYCGLVHLTTVVVIWTLRWYGAIPQQTRGKK